MAQKKTPTQKYIDSAAKKAAEETTTNHIENCHFVGVQYDAKAVNAIKTIADGLVENAKALGNLASILKSSNVRIDTMIKVDSK